jgi:hypothetical protein
MKVKHIKKDYRFDVGLSQELLNRLNSAGEDVTANIVEFGTRNRRGEIDIIP